MQATPDDVSSRWPRRASQGDAKRSGAVGAVGRPHHDRGHFLLAGLAKISDFEGTVGFMEAKGTAPAYWALQTVREVVAVLAILIELGCGLALLLGAWTRFSALLLAVYLIPVTLIIHAFWADAGVERQMEMFNFLKNLAIIGGLVYVAAYGAGKLGVDERRHGRALFEPGSLAKRLDRWFSASVKPWVRQ